LNSKGLAKITNSLATTPSNVKAENPVWKAIGLMEKSKLDDPRAKKAKSE
jgi:hypothetical protein